MSPATPSPPAPSAQSAALICGLAALIMLSLGLFDARLLNDGDTYWHLAAGRWMLQHGQVPLIDPFSATVAGAPWHAHEWLAEVIMTAAFDLGGWAGLMTLFALTLALIALLLGGVLSRSLTGLSLALTLAMALGCAAPNLLARPHVLILPLLIAWTGELLKARQAGRAPRLAFAALMWPWANMHGSFVFGFLILGVFGLEALAEAAKGERLSVVKGWGAFAGLALACATLNPHGVGGLTFPFQLMAMKQLSGLDEWRPMDFTTLGPFEITLGVTLFVALSRGVQVAPLRLLLLLGLLHMALQHNRHVMIAVMVGAMVLGAPLARALGQDQASAPTPSPAGDRRRIGLVGVAVAALALLAVRAWIPFVRVDRLQAALDHTPAAVRAQPVFNDYGFGGELIFRGVRPFIDGRTDLYGDAFMSRYNRIISPDPAALDGALKRYDVAWSLLPPASPLVAVMDQRPGWRRLYADDYAVVHVRNNASGASGG